MSQSDPGRRGDPAPERVGIVIAGAGARGAHEAGALSVIVPRLAAAGARPRVFVGTSAGALNNTLLALWRISGLATRLSQEPARLGPLAQGDTTAPHEGTTHASRRPR